MVFLALGFLISGCAFKRVEPWERDILAEEKMRLIPDLTENEMNQKIYFSKEGSSGGQGVGGGGCGCN